MIETYDIEWERANQSDITGWEVHYGEKVNGVFIYYDNYTIVKFNMKDGSIKEFRQEK